MRWSTFKPIFMFAFFVFPMAIYVKQKVNIGNYRLTLLFKYRLTVGMAGIPECGHT